MQKKSICALTFLFVFGGLAFLSGADRESSIFYLGKVAEGYPDDMLGRELKMAGADIVSIKDGMIIFGINEGTRLTKFMKNLPFLKEVYVDKASVLKDIQLKSKPIAQRFLTLPDRGAQARQKGIANSRLGERNIFPSEQGFTQEMVTLDRLIKDKAVRAAGKPFRTLQTDDIYEPNDTFETAAAVSAGTINGLESLNEDWYKISVSAGQDLIVTINYDPEITTLGLFLYDISESEISRSSVWGRDYQTVSGGNLAAGDWYIQVPYWYGDNSYSMTIQVGNNLVGYISGQVTDESAAGIENIEVNLYDSDGNFLIDVHTDSNGNYTSPGFVPGDYILYFWGLSAGNYVSEYYDDAVYFGDADLVSISAGSTTPNINAQLATGGAITGRVTDESTGDGLYDADVEVETSPYYSFAYTDADGYYTVQAIPTGSYTVYFSSYDNYVPEYFDNKTSYATADPVSVTAGLTTPNIDAALAPGGTISGQVTDESGNPLSDGGVEIYRLEGDFIAYGYTDNDGSYTVTQIPSGNFKVRFSTYYGYYCQEWYNNKDNFDEADQVSVMGGSETPNINAQLGLGGTIEGYVTDSSDNPIYDYSVRIYDLAMNEIYSTFTSETGFYLTSALKPGAYKIWFPGTYDYASEWYNDKNSFAAGGRVTVVGGESTSGIDAQLEAAGEIYGFVNSSPDGAITGVIAALYDTNQNYLWSALTNSNGYYGLNGLKAGNYKVYFDPAYALGQYKPEWYNNKGSFGTANSIAVAAGGYTGPINATLSSKATITVTSPATGETWTGKTTRTIQWLKTGKQSANVKIRLYRANTLVKTVILSTPNDGAFDWKISLLTPATNYRIRVITSDGKVSGYSGYFTIIKPSIQVTGPAKNETWTRGTTRTIVWTKTGDQNAAVKIRLYKGTTKILDINLNTENDGSYDWDIPTGLAAGTTYKIKVTTVDGLVSDSSDVFTLN